MFKRLKKNQNEVYEYPSDKLNFEDETEMVIYVIEHEFVSEWNKYSEREVKVESDLKNISEKIIFEEDDALVETYVKKQKVLRDKRESIFHRKGDIVHDIAVNLELEDRMYDIFSDPGVIVRALEDGRTTFEY